MTKPTLLLALSSLLATTTALATPASLPPPLPSQLTGTIQVLAVTSLYKATPKDSIGCLNNAGLLTLNDCAVFSHQSDGPGVLSTNLGNCSFQDRSMPENKESHYGRGTYAWRCTREELKEAVGEVYYTANMSANTTYSFIGNGNLDFWYDVPALPTKEKEAVPVWRFNWGSLQADVPEGHHKVAWIWVPVATVEGSGGEPVE